MEKISKKFWIGAALAAIIGTVICHLAVIGYFIFQQKLSLAKELDLVSARSVATVNLFAVKIASLKQQNRDLNDQVAGLNATIDQIEQDLAITQDERDSFENKYRHEKSRMDALDSQISDIQDTADTLQKSKPPTMNC